MNKPIVPGAGSSSSGSNTVPFPMSRDQQQPAIPDSESSISNLTSSDKLSALPVQASPMLDRLRAPSRVVRRSFDGSVSLSSNESPSASTQALHQLPGAGRMTGSEGSIGRETPKQIASFESDRTSLPATLQGFTQAANRINQRSDSAVPSSTPHSGEVSLHGGTPYQIPLLGTRQNQTGTLSPRLAKDGLQSPSPTSRSPSHSRNASPLRLFGFGRRTHGWEEPFVPVDPFTVRICWFGWSSSSPPTEPLDQDADVACNDTLTMCLPLPALCSTRVTKRGGGGDVEIQAQSEGGRWNAFASAASTFFADVLPRQVYLILLLRLPALYFSRVARVFEDAEVSKPDVQRMIDACAADESGGMTSTERVAMRTRTGRYRNPSLPLPFPDEWNPPMVSPSLVRFKHSWEFFVDSLLREWKTLNLVSALLCTAILTLFQVNAAANDPLTRSAALFSLIFSLMSVSYGCMYIVQFGTMRSMDRASRWAEEAQRSKTAIWWNIWVLLATPAIWLAWSMITFCIAILSFVWRTGSQADENPPPPLNAQQAIGVRTAITIVFIFGVVNFVMIVSTFVSYGEVRRDRRRGREEKRGDRGRERRDGMDESRERGRMRDVKGGTPGSMVGLGLTGLGEHEIGSGSVAGIVREEVDLEKREFLTTLKQRNKISPRL
ncbi:hypothetical protein BKA93DRAFT_311003 [Sparassis latifolia]